MKTEVLKKILSEFEKDLKAALSKIGIYRSSLIIGLQISDVSLWLRGKRIWSIKKQMRIAEILENHDN